MSLSFPILLSAVPLYAVDAEAQLGAAITTPASEPVRKYWFSDGGITINMPVHFFDKPLPQHPTFAINLRKLPAGPARSNDADRRNILMAQDNDTCVPQSWTDLDEQPGAAPLWAFLTSIFGAAQSWSDDLQLQMPGYRDRVVHVLVGDDEGGLNLNMTPAAIGRLSKRGAWAGAELVRRFAPDTAHPLSWDNHRWLRYRNMMTMLEETLQTIQCRYDQRLGVRQLTYRELVACKADRAYNNPCASVAQADFVGATEQLVHLAADWQQELKGKRFADGTPQPVGEWQIRPRL